MAPDTWHTGGKNISVAANFVATMVSPVGWQDLAAVAIVLLTIGLLVWSRFRPRKFNFQRDTHCGCSSPADSAAKSSIVFHARKGERPQVVMKMK